jgi:hypothetical protein
MMKLFLLSFLTTSSLVASAQTNLMSQINDNGKTLSIHVTGKKNGQSVDRTHTFNIVGLNRTQKDSLMNRVLDSLGLGDKPMPMPSSLPIPNNGEPMVTFVCETCTGKGKLVINGNNYSTTHEFDLTKNEKSTFPFELPLVAGDYRLMYWQNKVLQIQSSFTVKEGEKKEVKVK